MPELVVDSLEMIQVNENDGQRITISLGAYDLAIGLERDPAVRRFLQKKRVEVSSARS